MGSICSGIGSIFGGGGSGGGSSSFHPYSPTGLGSADTLWQNIMSSMANGMMTSPVPNNIFQQLPGIYNQLIGNVQNAAPGMQAAAQNASNYLGSMASQADQFHNLMTDQYIQDINMQAALTPMAQQVANTAFDPQKALYDRTANQVEQQTRGAQQAAGTAFGPYGAGIDANTMSNFNIDWQNAQLQRQLAGLQGMGQGFTTAGRLGDAASGELTGAQQMSALAPNLLMQAASMPMNTVQGLLSQDLQNMGAAGQLFQSQTLSPWANIAGMTIPYMNYGTGAQANAFGAGQANLGNLVGLGGILSNQYGMGPGRGYGLLGNAAGGLSNLFSNPFGSSVAAVSGGDPTLGLTAGELGSMSIPDAGSILAAGLPFAFPG